MKTIGYYGAMDSLAKSPVAIMVHGWGCCPAVRIADDFMLISVPGGSNGTHAEAGDWVVLHPDGYPTIVKDEVAWRNNDPRYPSERR